MPYEHIRATLDYNEDITECHNKIYVPQPWLEDIQFTVEPNFFDGLTGTHTYSFKDGLMAIDFR